MSGLDFSLDESMVALAELGRTVADQATSPEQVAAAEQRESRLDGRFWEALASTGLASITSPATAGGLGLGLLEAVVAGEALGRAVSLVPWREQNVAAWVLRRHGSDALVEALLGDAVAISGVIGIAIEPDGRAPGDVASVDAVVSSSGGVRLDGRVAGVGWADLADRLLVAYRHDAGQGIAAVSPDAAGIELTFAPSTDHQLLATLTLDAVEVPAVDLCVGDAAVADALAAARLLAAAEVVGACERAIELTVEHGNARQQFGQALSANQAYRQRLADAAITLDAMRATVRQAAWAIDQGKQDPAATRVAAWWAADGGARIVRATQHLHGGMGADISYPVHRHFLAVQQRMLTLGSPGRHLAAIGATLAEGAP